MSQIVGKKTCMVASLGNSCTWNTWLVKVAVCSLVAIFKLPEFYGHL